MTKIRLQKTMRGVYFIEIPENFIRITRWKEGDEIEVIAGSSAQAKRDDLILRKSF